ncbi:uncharacterized protein VTP21DRAFT_773 [Calcarisporiella thermophila]|uniref:uncharacterized protein n=1 Tax=Calcarisporiella thermophila TaxID=911321 RepID=UPI003743512F
MRRLMHLLSLFFLGFPSIAAVALPPHSIHSETQTLNIYSSLEVRAVSLNCPYPLIEDPGLESNSTVSALYCDAGCCIPCPQGNFLYHEGLATKGATAVLVIRITSALLIFLLALSYFLPEKRTHPFIFILYAALSVTVMCGTSFFSIGDESRLKCAGPVLPATQDNSTICGVEGALFIFGTMSTILWVGAIIVNLFLNVKYSSDVLRFYYPVLYIICWGIPALITTITLALHKVEFWFPVHCFVAADVANLLFYLPTALISFPIFFLHFLTFFHIIKVSLRDSKTLSSSRERALSGGEEQTSVIKYFFHYLYSSFRMQWRAMSIAFMTIFVFIFHFSYQFTQQWRINDALSDAALMKAMINCFREGNSQNVCVDRLSNYRVPPFPLLLLAELFISLVGIGGFVTFFRMSLVWEWVAFFRRIRWSRILCL